MRIDAITTFPTMFDSVMGASMMKRAQDKQLLQFEAHDLREWTFDRHRSTDDEPYGGGAGLVMKCEPIFQAVKAIQEKVQPTISVSSYIASGDDYSFTGGVSSCIKRENPAINQKENPTRVCCTSLANEDTELSSNLNECTVDEIKPCRIFLAPVGKTFTDTEALKLSKKPWLMFICGHYEGIDERAYELADEVYSIGDYVLTSGELAAMVIIDATVRKLPGVLGADEGLSEESFTDSLLEYPQYTRPANFEGREVPEVLLSGNHKAINTWRRQQSLKRTALLRPDLLGNASLTEEDLQFLRSLNL